MPYVAYLRKSRADQEAEQRGEGDTFARHEKILIDLAQRQKLPLTDIYRELVSGETISARPVMQQLLSEVEAGLWDGVLVVEVERLARGDTSDQGRVQKTFFYSNTLIVTPMKTYDPTNEYDQEYFEFGLFMSRREYKTINRRLQAGRISSIREGKYPGNIPPYGYLREKLPKEKGFILTPHPEQAPVVRQIFAWYADTENHLGVAKIATRLNQQHVPTFKGNEWTISTVQRILQNPVYCGYLIWGRRAHVKQMKNGEITTSRPWSKNYEKVKGLHEPLVDEETFDRVQQLFMLHPRRPVPKKKIMQNPLSGLIVCGMCGRKLQRRPYNSGRQATLICTQAGCANVSSDLRIVEQAVLESLRKWLEDYKTETSIDPDRRLNAELEGLKQSLHSLYEKQNELFKMQQRAYELVEQGVYTTAVFLERQQQLTAQRNNLEASISDLENQVSALENERETKKQLIPKVQHVLDVYGYAETDEEKNRLLTSVLEKVIYMKTTNNRWSTENDMELTIFPRFSLSCNH
ncbi:recombinase family protein [Intestinibacillus massiliensis]|uniref:recombinase family protein n=1 Tax=Intestinibacillus massiliensis TaxID=1871029 RepID=UPI000B362BDA|nr:recombinase family protein [Intestinibacillus massiliensis]